MARRKLTASVITGVVVKHDAISNIARQQVEALSKPGYGFDSADVKLYTIHTDVDDPRIVTVPTALELTQHSHFRSSDLIIFNYGICYPLFEAIHLAPRMSRVVAAYFGITPSHLVPAESRSTVMESYRQAASILAADRVITTAETLRLEIERLGVDPKLISLVRPSVGVPIAPAVPRTKRGERLKLLYVGRFVPAKGVMELVQAVIAAKQQGIEFELTLAGSVRWADQEYLNAVKELAQRELKGRLTFHADLPDAELAQLYQQADLFVLPSHHEGFGVPIIEALRANCFVITSDAGACPETLNGCGLTFPAGDVSELTERLVRTAHAMKGGYLPTESGGTITNEAWTAKTHAYVATYTEPAFSHRLRDAVLPGLAVGSTSFARSYLAEAQREVLGHPMEDPSKLPKLVQKLDDLLASAKQFLPPSPPAAKPSEPASVPESAPAAPVESPAAPALVTPPSPIVTAAPPQPQTRGRFRGVRHRLNGIPLIGRVFRYMKRLIMLPWNFHKHYHASHAYQVELLSAIVDLANRQAHAAELSNRQAHAAELSNRQAQAAELSLKEVAAAVLDLAKSNEILITELEQLRDQLAKPVQKRAEVPEVPELRGKASKAEAA